MEHTHVTAPTRFVEGAEFVLLIAGSGKRSDCLWSLCRTFVPAWIIGIHRSPTDLPRTGRLFCSINAGVAGSSGETPDAIEAMADHAAAFIAELGLSLVDVLGFSIGGYIAQALVPSFLGT
jgi:pimeloyl-ACP methyl ester carboxylesterase